MTLVSVSANAALLSRLGGLAYYDDVAGLTWLADANAAGTTMNWSDANTWAAGLDVAGVTGWRLPDTLQPDASCNAQNIYGQGLGYGCTGSEMGNFFYNVLGGIEGSSITDNHNSNYDLFDNIQSYHYWSATEYSPDTGNAWFLNFHGGYQTTNSKGATDTYAWAVYAGDVGAVPIPAALWLFGSGLLGLIGLARRKS
jgi:hypothetical protein